MCNEKRHSSNDVTSRTIRGRPATGPFLPFAKMFSTPQQLARRTGIKGTDRFHYLQELVTEFQTTADQEAKRQVLANLANFAYDPINYDWLWQLNVIDLFLGGFPMFVHILANRETPPRRLQSISDADEKLNEFGMGGICNICLMRACVFGDPAFHISNGSRTADKRNKDYINSKPGNIASIIARLSDDNEETVLNAITILMFLVTPASKRYIIIEPVKSQMFRFASSPNPRLANIAKVFLQDYFEEPEQQ
ncbi:hypothetical protein BC936DRAFT_137878 [Jimgerdemannia flammicorona]|uniref:Armadillo-type protein n=1 Tax=Jimgerdemannia flammicorona TaxID=994334 RepID=A0A433CWG5_9FUNG|nr:hypothetical protein BC936DRAFT_137878 [Jimgerdemannia flammicorona]